MATFRVNVKWNKELYSDVELNASEPPVVFKAQLFALTGVQPDRQKVMFKGTVIKDDEWPNMQLKDGITILMMGTREELPSAPKEQIRFMEDMSESELATALKLPAGLNNLGNTCYMNATVQCLRMVPELKQSLQSFSGSVSLTSGDASLNITAALRDLYQTMEKTATVPPIILLQVLHNAFPRFAERTENGIFQQQDANECWSEIMRMLQQKLTPTAACSHQNRYNSLIEQYFGGTFKVEMKCKEATEEPSVFTSENFLQLSCFISTDVKYLQSGLNLRLQESLTKFSATLNRDAEYNKISKISRLPAYLTIQFVRFFYKERESVNAKILKDIKFSLSLDVYELCTPELQQKLNPMRAKFKEMDDKKVAEAQTAKKEEKKDEKKKNLIKHPYSFEDDSGSNNSGYYELQAVLTHKGRSSSSGHYVAWIKSKENEWFKCDDDVVSVVTSEEILKLSGGGDWHTAYVLLYSPRILETES